jgi:mxaJ protein
MRLVVLGMLLGAQLALGQAFGRQLVVCADPNNLPFSNEQGQGFENKLAELVARELKAELRYVWFPQRRGFLRQTLKAGRCDLVMGVPSRLDFVATTRPYYRSGYVFVYGPRAPRVRSLDAPELRTLRIGVPLVGEDGENPPPIYALAQRHLEQNAKGYLVTGDYSQESPPSQLIHAVSRGEVDLAIAWGPLAGYYAQNAVPPLTLGPLPEGEAPVGQTFAFEISMGVRQSSSALREELNRIIAERHTEIAALLDSFAVPRL